MSNPGGDPSARKKVPTQPRVSNGFASHPAGSSSTPYSLPGRKRPPSDADQSSSADSSRHTKSPSTGSSPPLRSPRKVIFKAPPPAPAAQVDLGVRHYRDYGRVISVDEESYPQLEPLEYDPHTCDPTCKMYETLPGVDQYVKIIHSPLILPSLFGWHRMYNPGSPNAIRKTCSYISPCGRNITTERGLLQYLSAVESILPPSCFSFDGEMDPSKRLVISKTKLKMLHEDITTGVGDPFTIPAVNCYSDKAPEPFTYVRKTTRSESASAQMVEMGLRERVVGCTCEGRCGRNCLCRQSFDKPGYQCGRLRKKQMFVVECNEYCGCGPMCGNRVSSDTIPFPTLLYFYPDKAWGVRAICDIPKGTFMGFYHGQIVHTGEVTPEHDKYTVALDLEYQNEEANSSLNRTIQENKEFTMDAGRFGNIARFFNHCCDPNLFAMPLFKENFDWNVYNIGFFTNRNVSAGEELCWDYGYKVDELPGRVIMCRCGAATCRGRLL